MSALNSGQITWHAPWASNCNFHYADTRLTVSTGDMYHILLELFELQLRLNDMPNTITDTLLSNFSLLWTDMPLKC